MRHTKAIAISSTAAVLLAISASSADARWYRRHYGPGPVAGFVGGVVVGAATIATLPFAVLGAAARPAPPPPPAPAYYGPGPGPYGYGSPPPGYYRQYGPPPGYYGGY
jgi:hypothetical protein